MKIIKLIISILLMTSIISCHHRRPVINPLDPGTTTPITPSILPSTQTIYAGFAGLLTTYGKKNAGNIVKLDPTGIPDDTFNTNVINDDPSFDVYSIAIKSSGGMYVGGDYMHIIEGGALSMSINSDGSYDSKGLSGGFGTVDGIGYQDAIAPVVLQDDGKILLVQMIGGAPSYRAQLRRFYDVGGNGGEDNSLIWSAETDNGPTNRIHAIAVQDDGYILVGGKFTNFSGAPASNIARIDNNGNIDPSFDTAIAANDYVKSVVISGDKVYIAGDFTSYKGVRLGRIARLNISDGSLDTSFNSIGGADGCINSMVVKDNKVWIAGDFTSYKGTSIGRIARLNSDGSLDTEFKSGLGADDIINAIDVENNNKVVMCGAFKKYQGTAVGIVTRLNEDGSLDTGFLSLPQPAGDDSSCWAVVVKK